MHRCRTQTKIYAAFAALSLAAMAVAQTPSIAGYDPYHGKAGDIIDITGSNLGTATAIYFNGVASPNIVIKGGSYLTAEVPAGATTGKLKVVNPAGEYTTSSDFVVDGTGGGGGSDPGGSGGGDSSSTVVVPPNIAIPAGSMKNHPRIFVRLSDLAKYKSWATHANPIWDDLLYLANIGKTRMDNGQIQDVGDGAGNVPAPVESYAELFAFMSLVHPNPSTRLDYAQRAHDLVMIAFNQADLGMQDGQPYRMHNFATENRASWYSEGFALTVDWCYQTFTAAEKAKIRRVFLRWIQENCHATTTASEHPRPLNVYNDPQLVDDYNKIRWATNNYYANHAREIALMALALDEVDDVPSAPDQPAAGTLRKFVGHVMQTWMYQMMKFEKTVGAGGISPEGVGYGELSHRAVALTLLGLHTANIDKTDIYGSAAGLRTSTYWTNEVIEGYLHMMSPSKLTLKNWIGPSYVPYTFSDAAYYENVDQIRVFGPLAVLAMNAGNTDRYARLRWMIDNLPEGGVSNRSSKIRSAFEGSSVLLGICYFLATDPNFSAIVDPRPELPTEYFAKGLGILSSRTDWSPTASWFVAKSSWNTIDHQFADANSIAFWRGGEWLTKPHLGYGPTIACSDYQNTITVDNPGNTTLSFWVDNMNRGSQYVYNKTQDPKDTIWSTAPDFTFFQSDTTALYNNPSISANNVDHVSRSTIFLKPDVVVTYDRVTTKTAGSYKRYWLNTAKQASISGHSALMTTDSGQQLAIDTLLPTDAVLTSTPQESLSGQPAQYEPMAFRFRAEPLSSPADVRFLNVLQGVDAGGTKLPTSYFESTSGNHFDGTLIGNVAVAFKTSYTSSFSLTRFVVPVTTSKIYVTGLDKNAGYTVTITNVAGGKQVKIAKTGPSVSDKAGVLVIQ